MNVFRVGTILIPKLVIWLTLAITIRRDLSCTKVLNWMISGFRWLSKILPPINNVIANGTISHARVRIGIAFCLLPFNFTAMPP